MTHVLVALGAVVLLLSCTTATAQQGGDRLDVVVGGGQHDSGTANQAFSASLTFSVIPGDNFSHGYMSLNSTILGKAGGTVICLDINMNHAFIRWRQDRDDNPEIPQGTHMLTEVVDNGPPVGGLSQDLIRNSLPSSVLPGTALNPCGTSLLPLMLLERGNITVHDGDGLP